MALPKRALVFFPQRALVLVGAVATALGELFRQAGTALAGPFWQTFFTQMAQLAVVIIQLSGPIIGNLATVFAGILQAFAPLAPVIGQALVSSPRGSPTSRSDCRATRRFSGSSTMR